MAIVRGETKYYHGVCTPRYKIITLDNAAVKQSRYLQIFVKLGSFAIINTVILMDGLIGAAEVSANGGAKRCRMARP